MIARPSITSNDVVDGSYMRTSKMEVFAVKVSPSLQTFRSSISLALVLELERTEQIEVRFELKFTYGTIIGIDGL